MYQLTWYFICIISINIHSINISINPLTVRAAIWLFGVTTSCSTDQSVKTFLVHLITQWAYPIKVHALMRMFTGITGTFKDYCTQVT